MIKEISLIFLLLVAVFLAGCAQNPPQTNGTQGASGLEQDSKDLEASIAGSETELDNSLNDAEDIEAVNPEDLQEPLAQLSGLEPEDSLLSQENSAADSLDTEFSDFSSTDALEGINPADLQ